jgi:hypothetical protein
MMRTTAVAKFAGPRGSALVTLDAAGQVTCTAGGLSAGRINSIRSVSPLGVIWPAANSMRDDVDTAGVLPVEATASGANANRGRLMGRKPGLKVRIAQYL